MTLHPLSRQLYKKLLQVGAKHSTAKKQKRFVCVREGFFSDFRLAAPSPNASDSLTPIILHPSGITEQDQRLNYIFKGINKI